jgi:signal transduction histidine kinase
MVMGDDDCARAARDAALAKRQPFEWERLVLSPQGRRWVLERGSGCFDANGALRAVAGFTLDITPRKERELELDARANAERSAREHSDALTATTDQFIASVSHELRSPLNAIVTWAEVLQLTADPAGVAQAGEAIRRNGRQLSLMVDDLLDSGAIATGKLSVTLSKIDLAELVTMAIEDVRKQAEHKNLCLRAEAIAPCPIMGDESRMRQVIWNLLSNAIKFTDAGTIEIAIRTANGQAELTVRDSGLGIEAAALPFVFDRFRQLAPRSSGRVGGLGLGLWLVKHIVGLHGGTVCASSDGPGCGSTFTVRLPIA